MHCVPPVTFTVPPVDCSPVAAELNHCEHGRQTLFTCELSPAAAQPAGQEHIHIDRVYEGEDICVLVDLSCQPLEIPGNVI